MTGPVVYVSRFVPEYRFPVLEALDRALEGRLVVCAGQPPDASFASLQSSAPPPFRQIHLRNRWIGGDRLHAQPVRPILKLKPVVLIAEESPRSVTLPLLLRSAKKQCVPTLLWGHFSSNNRPFGSSHWLDRYRIALARYVDGCVGYTEDIAASLSRLIPSERVFAARNTLDLEPLLNLHAQLSREGKSAVRRRLGLPVTQPCIAFIGRLIPEKGLQELLDVYAALVRQQEVTLVIIGEGPERYHIETRVTQEGWTHVFLPGAITDHRQSAPYLFASDVLLSPGYVGLAVNHAFALGLPVITQASPDPCIRFHSPEITYLESGTNGLVVPHGDIAAMAQAVRMIIDDRDRYSANALAYAREELDLQTMVSGLVQAIGFAESNRQEITTGV